MNFLTSSTYALDLEGESREGKHDAEIVPAISNALPAPKKVFYELEEGEQDE